MKYLIIILIMLLVGFAVSAVISTMIGTGGVTPSQQQEAFFPEPTNYVVDAAGALSQITVDSLNADLKAFGGRAQIAVAIIETTAPLTIGEYGIRLAEKWKVGYAGKDNGAIIILAVEDRKVRIEVGKGLEGNIPDAVTGRIIDEAMFPHLKNSDWNAAIVGGVQAIKGKLTK